MRNVEKPRAIRACVHTFFMTETTDIVHTATAHESSPLLEIGGTVTVDNELLIVVRIADHYDVLSATKYYLYELEQVDKEEADVFRTLL